MPVLSKESRQRLLDEKLFKGEHVNFKTFKAFIEREYLIKINVRTFERDIKDLKVRLADRNNDDETKFLSKDRQHNTYKIIKEYSAFEETSLIKGNKIGKLLKYNRNFITDIDRIVRKQIDKAIKDFVEEEDIKIPWQPVSFINRENAGQPNFPALLNHISAHEPIVFTHTNIRKQKLPKTHYVIPLLIKEVDNGFAKVWFMLAQKFNEGDKAIDIQIPKFNIYGIDRIKDIKKYPYPIKINKDENLDPNDYFKDSFRGTFRENLTYPDYGPELVKLKVLDTLILEQLKSYPLHASQKIIMEGDEVFIELNIETAYDLQKFIFANSEDLVVVYPETLKEEIKKLLIRANKNYGIGE